MAIASGTQAKQRSEKVAKLLAAEYPDAACALEFSNPLQLLIATILSAQCTDVRVNMVTPALFKKYPTAAALVAPSEGTSKKPFRAPAFFAPKPKASRKLAASWRNNTKARFQKRWTN